MATKTTITTTLKGISRISIGLASPERVLALSKGEVLKPETINYRSYKPERDGLFCMKIFGCVKDYECHCGKYKRIRYRGITCDRCGVEITEKKVRRERMGHIALVVPVVHIWYFRSLPNKIGYLLGLPTKKLDQIIYYEKYVVINPGNARNPDGEQLVFMDFLSEEDYLTILDQQPADAQYLDDKDPNKFVAKMGADALHDILKNLDLDALANDLRHRAHQETSQQRKTESLKRLQVVEAFREAKEKKKQQPEWMIVKIVPVIPPELRPLVPLDGGRFATADLNDLYRRVIIRNNRLKRLLEIKAPEVILRNEKRMLQESVDSLFDNTRKSSAVKTESNRPLKSLSDSLKGKQGRFRQNLLGKRVDYSARSVIVVGPELKMHECGLPKDIAAELYKPFIIRKLIERGIVKTVKSAKRIVERKDAVIWDILENVLRSHPVLLNRAPTLHRLGIQAFQPKMIEGKAIQLHPLVCTAFNADFDGDQMAIHLPLSNAAILEAQLLMLASHNILNPANGAPITVPSQDMVLGLYYITKGKKSTPEEVVLGENRRFYSAEEVIIAYNEKTLDLHAHIHCRVRVKEGDDFVIKTIETTCGRVIFNQVVPEKISFINEVLTKRALRDIIGEILKETDIPTAADFLDKIKNLGFYYAFKGGLSFNLADVIIPDEKVIYIAEAQQKVDEVVSNYNIGLITNNERYNQIIDIWTHTNAKLTNLLMNNLEKDKQGFNSIYMMMDSGARGSKEQIRQLSGMRGLMAKPQKSGSSNQEIIENPILTNFKEGLTVFDYFISTHGARKGLADTALKTADAGYLTRRLVDVAQDVIINAPDCGTLRGIMAVALKKNDEIVESLYDRILGRVAASDVLHPETDEVIVEEGTEITEHKAILIDELGIDTVEIRSVLTCELTKGVCAKCYGRHLSTKRLVNSGDAVGVIAAQSIGEPGTQLTLRTFHVGGTASNIADESEILSKADGIIEIDDLRMVTRDEHGEQVSVVIGRSTEMRLLDKVKGSLIQSAHIPYGSVLRVKSGAELKKGQVICSWDPYNAVILSETAGHVVYEGIEEGITYRQEIDEQTGFAEKVVIESKDKKKVPVIRLINPESGELIKSSTLPVNAHIVVNDGDKILAGRILVKIPRIAGKTGDITGGLPRVTELFEARNPSNPAVVSEIDGFVSFGKVRRGNQEVIIESKSGEIRRYLCPLSRHILVQENDYVRAGTALTDGAVSPADILSIKGPVAVQEYLVNEIQEVYRLQGVKINDKHFEIIVRQMLKKVEVVDSGDTRFLEKDVINKMDFMIENNRLYTYKIVEDAGDSALQAGQMISARQLRDENSALKRQDKKLVQTRDAMPATAIQLLQGITRASLQTESFISAASFQETTKVLCEAAIRGKSDDLSGLKENVIVGNPIPAGTGFRKFQDLIVGSREELEKLRGKRKLGELQD
jgi:DNA-directed RNA polymerase subunit beta'